MNSVCSHCKTLKYKNEANGLCCANDKVKLIPLNPPPEPLYSLVSGIGTDSIHFLKNIEQYNSCFQMTSFGVTNVVQENFMPTFKDKDCSDRVNQVNQKQVCNTEEVTIKVEYEESGCTYEEEQTRKIVECPNCKYEFCVPMENAEKETIPSRSIPLNAPSNPESVFETLEIQKLAFKTALEKKLKIKVKSLQQQNKRLIDKNMRLKSIIANVKKNKGLAAKVINSEDYQ